MKVVNIHTCKPPFGQMGDIRIDRKTKWGNPYPLPYDTPSLRSTVIQKYEVWVKQQIAEGKLDIDELAGATRLGCHCKPKECHGDVLVRLFEEKHNREQTTLELGGFKWP